MGAEGVAVFALLLGSVMMVMLRRWWLEGGKIERAKREGSEVKEEASSARKAHAIPHPRNLARRSPPIGEVFPAMNLSEVFAVQSCNLLSANLRESSFSTCLVVARNKTRRDRWIVSSLFDSALSFHLRIFEDGPFVSSSG